MIDDNWDLINGEAAHAIEVLNYSNQVNVIEALVRLLTHNHGVDEKGCIACPNINVLREFHRTATLFLLHQPGEYRTNQVHVAKQDGTVVHLPPPADEVAGLKIGFFLPGSPTVIDLIMQNRDEYQAALKVADESYAANGSPDLSPMSAFVGRLLVQQLSTVPDPS